MLCEHSALLELIRLYPQSSPVSPARLEKILAQSDADLIGCYQQLIPHIEFHLWQDKLPAQALDLYYQMFQALESLYSARADDSRHQIIVVMPLADRPQHLQACLNSLLELCEAFAYGGRNTSQQFAKISVLIADDSQSGNNILRHKDIIRAFECKGLCIEYFGLQQQQQQLAKLTVEQRQSLVSVLGEHEDAVKGHKGASIMRNIAYLRLQEIQQKFSHSLIYFIDSDQEFKLNQQTVQGESACLSLNYFYYLDRLFTEHNISILTGKVVGDPPVSPAVMAARFIDDVSYFFNQLKPLSAQSSCQFHQLPSSQLDDGAYHDMADLFGLKSSAEATSYQCDLQGKHQHIQMLENFSEKLRRFFDGEHPTRKSYYTYSSVLETVQQARTIYTGNYVFKASALKYFIPFAPLKLRMAGPVLGRIIKAELGEEFVSANLPMLHRRTVKSLGQSEYRPGIKRQQNCIDLSDEFERQFFGDVMLFSIEKIYQQGELANIDRKSVMLILKNTESELYQRYDQKHQQLIEKISCLQSIVSDPEAWWNQLQALAQARQAVNQFIDNMDHNFGVSARAYKLIQNRAHKQQRLNHICDAILTYKHSRDNWQKLLEQAG